MINVLDIVEEGEDCLEEEVYEDSLLLENSVIEWIKKLKDEAIKKVRSEIKDFTDPEQIADKVGGMIKGKAKKVGKQMYTGKKRS